MSSITECSEKAYLKDFVHGRSVDEESEQQDIDDDLFGKRFENDLLWLAREDVMKPSPSGGIACQKENGESYDFYFNTGKSSWNHPYDDIYKTRVIQAREKKTLSSIVFDTLSKDSQDVNSDSNGIDREENESTAVITPYSPMSFTINTEENSEDNHERIQLASLAAQTAEHPLNTNKSSSNDTTSTIRLEQ
ncbi:unnamed protein product [Rotaria sp. Silwood1]|nr:unnamed protein product [Rotaria sp. Silwood1]